MCLILDANRYSDFINKDNEDMKPIRKWLDRGGKNLCGGSIYQNRSHQHLLTPDLCP